MMTAISSDMTPNWPEIGRLSRKMSFTVRLREVKEGPKFIQRIHTEPTFALTMKSSNRELDGGVVVMCGIMTLYM